MGWGAAIAAIFTALLPLIQFWLSKAPAHEAKENKEDSDDTNQKMRTDLLAGNSDSVSTRIDGVLTSEQETSCNNAGSQSRVSSPGTSSISDRLSSFGISISKTP